MCETEGGAVGGAVVDKVRVVVDIHFTSCHITSNTQHTHPLFLVRCTGLHTLELHCRYVEKVTCT